MSVDEAPPHRTTVNNNFNHDNHHTTNSVSPTDLSNANESRKPNISTSMTMKQQQHLAQSLLEMGYAKSEKQLCEQFRDADFLSIVGALHSDLCDALHYISEKDDEFGLRRQEQQQLRESIGDNRRSDQIERLIEENQKLKMELHDKRFEIEELKIAQNKESQIQSNALEDLEFLKENLLKKIETLEKEINHKTEFINDALNMKSTSNNASDKYSTRNYTYSRNLPDKIILQARQAMEVTSNIDFENNIKSPQSPDDTKIALQDTLENKIMQLNAEVARLEGEIDQKNGEIQLLKSKIELLGSDNSKNIITENIDISDIQPCASCQKHFDENFNALRENLVLLQKENEFLIHEVERFANSGATANSLTPSQHKYNDDSIVSNNDTTNSTKSANSGQINAQKRLLIKEVNQLKSLNQKYLERIDELETKNAENKLNNMSISGSGKDDSLPNRYENCLSKLYECREKLERKSHYANELEEKYIKLLEKYENYRKQSVSNISKYIQTEPIRANGIDQQVQSNFANSVIDHDDDMPAKSAEYNVPKLCQSCVQNLKDCEILRSENFLLKSQIEAKDAKYEQLQEDFTGLISKNNDIVKNLEVSKLELKTKQKKIKELEAAITDNEASLNHLKRNLEHMEVEYENLSSHSHQMTSKSLLSETKCDTLRVDLESKTSNLLKLRSENLKLKSDNEKIEATLLELNDENRKLKSAILDLNDEIKSAKQFSYEENRELETKKAEFIECMSKLDMLNSSYNTLKAEFDSQQKSLDSEKDKFTNAMQHQNKLIDDSNDLRARIDHLDCIIEESNSKNQDLEKQISVLSSNLQDKNVELQRYSHQIAEMRNIIKCNAETIVKWKSKYEESQKNYNDSIDSENFTILNDKFKENESKLKSLESEKSDLSDSLTKSNSRISELSSELDHRLSMIETLKRLLNKSDLTNRNNNILNDSDNVQQQYKSKYECLLQEYNNLKNETNNQIS